MTDNEPTQSATHIRLVCWDHHHVQAISAVALRQIIVAPICTAPNGDDICGSPIWAVQHEDEPKRYVGRPPHRNWQHWADCIPGSGQEQTGSERID